MRKLTVDMQAIVDAMSIGDDPFGHYLNARTGEIADVFKEGGLELIGDERDDAEALREAVLDDPDYVEIPSVGSRYDYTLMERFAASIDEDDICEKLEIALSGRGAFSRFRDVVHRYPDLAEQWHATRHRALVEEATEWLHGLDIEPEHALRRPQFPQSALEPARDASLPQLLDVLLLARAVHGDNLVDGCIVRQVDMPNAGEANRLFKRLAREICEFCGVAWRKRYAQGKSDFDMDRLHLRKQGTLVELQIDVDEAVRKLLLG